MILLACLLTSCQFLHCDAKSTFLLFILDKEFVHLYEIFTRRRQRGGYGP